MQYEFSAISDAQVPRAREPIFQHMLDTYASETKQGHFGMGRIRGW
jgi:hypothetical protein